MDRNREKEWKIRSDESTCQIESQQRVKSEQEQKDFSLADSQGAELVSLTDDLNTLIVRLRAPYPQCTCYSTQLYSTHSPPCA